MALKVAVIGGNGKIGQLLLKKLSDLTPEFTATALIRNPDQLQHFQDQGISAKLASVTDSVATLTQALAGFDAVVFSAGAGGKGGLENTLAVDLDGAVKVMEAAAASKPGMRFILVSALKADDREFYYKGPLKNYYICKMYADRELRRAAGLEYTILRPGMLLDGKGTGEVMDLKVCADVSGVEASKVGIFREDVATAIIESLRNKNTINKTIPLLNGPVSIAEFLEKF